ncbi:MAG TPA: UDP-3-O-(3-hydroxymyristoyl)glucosamine N-acyltransferase [Steroidobacteraceae bacterium]|nr:UDP-3-O-(3-hydroxymyristoyl)glucosamine N-acyltransferase [Steroidobacteraceae bacterium]
MQGDRVHSLGELAVRVGLELRGDPTLRVSQVATLAQAKDGSLSFLANSRYRKHLGGTHATAVVVAPGDADACPVAALVDSNPYLAYAHIATLMYPSSSATPGVHPSAAVAPEASIAPCASVGPMCVIEAGAVVGQRVRIGPGCTILAGAHVGADTQLMPRVTLYPAVSVGMRCILHSGVVIGADGFGFAPDFGTWVKVPQVGSVRIGDDVEIGANTTIDRGAIGDTIVENGVKLDNQIQVGHNVIIGAHTAIAACTGISGSTVIGQRCLVGGMVGFAGHLTIADDVTITGCSLVSASIREAGSYSSGMPTVETRLWRRMVANLRRLGQKER